jgi:hypothetical protein
MDETLEVLERNLRLNRVGLQIGKVMKIQDRERT